MSDFAKSDVAGHKFGKALFFTKIRYQIHVTFSIELQEENDTSFRAVIS